MAQFFLTLAAPATVLTTRCFVHVVNLVARSLLKLFDQPKPKKKKKASDDDDDNGVEEAARERDSCGQKEKEENPVDIEDIMAQLKELEMGITDHDDPDDTFDALATMFADAKEKFFGEVRVVISALRKVSLSRAVIRSIQLTYV